MRKNQIYSRRIAEIRRSNHWTQKELAEELRVAQNTVSAWEQGKNEPNITTLCRIAKIFDVSIDYICGYEKNRR